MHKAYFPIYKDIFKTELVKKPNPYLLYSWLNYEACVIEKDIISFNGKNIEITYGKLSLGLNIGRKKTGFSEMNLRSFLAYLEKNNFIKKESNKKFSIITILSKQKQEI